MTKLPDLPKELIGKIALHIRVPQSERANAVDDIAEEYAVEMSPEIPGGCLIWGKYRGVWHANASGRYLLSRLISPRFNHERLPQRFRYRKYGCNGWDFGVCLPMGEMWIVNAGSGFGSFDDDPWEIIGHIIGDTEAFEWIDNDFGWEG